MILLVWNSVETAGLAFQGGFPDVSGTAGEQSAPVLPIPPQAPSESVNPTKAPLSTRQKYLLGKQLDINTATMEEFNALPGISDAMAAEIVQERAKMGGFRSPRDLMRVRGIKEKRLEKILPFLKKMANN